MEITINERLMFYTKEQVTYYKILGWQRKAGGAIGKTFTLVSGEEWQNNLDS